LHDFDPSTQAVSYDQLPELDRYMLHRVTEVFGEVTAAFESYQFFRFFQAVQNFCVVDLSNFYLDIAKDRLYISATDSQRRRSCQTVLAIVLERLAIAISPVLCHMAEDIWQYLPYDTGYKSVFQAGWVKLDPQWQQEEMAKGWRRLRDTRDDINKLLDQARTEKLIGSSLEAKALLCIDGTPFPEHLPPFANSTNQVDELRYFFLVSQVEFVDTQTWEQAEYHVSGLHGLKVAITKADGHKCDRCWNYSDTVGTHHEHDILCDRCVGALAGEF
jgi:isoleucyl-tRNA synthetase